MTVALQAAVALYSTGADLPRCVEIVCRERPTLTAREAADLIDGEVVAAFETGQMERWDDLRATFPTRGVPEC